MRGGYASCYMGARQSGQKQGCCACLQARAQPAHMAWSFRQTMIGASMKSRPTWSAAAGRARRQMPHLAFGAPRTAAATGAAAGGSGAAAAALPFFLRSLPLTRPRSARAVFGRAARRRSSVVEGLVRGAQDFRDGVARAVAPQRVEAPQHQAPRGLHGALAHGQMQRRVAEHDNVESRRVPREVRRDLPEMRLDVPPLVVAVVARDRRGQILGALERNVILPRDLLKGHDGVAAEVERRAVAAPADRLLRIRERHR